MIKGYEQIDDWDYLCDNGPSINLFTTSGQY